MRIGTASAANATIDSLNARQSSLGNLQQQVSAGKKVLRPSDDPGGAGQAERARTRIDRIQIEQRALVNQRASLGQAESTLGDATTLLQSARDLMTSASNPALGASDRASIAAALSGMRDQLLGLANRNDSNGMSLFGGLSASGNPFVDTGGGVQFTGAAGQSTPGQTAVPHALDGQSLWMNVPSGNGVFSATPATGNTGGAWTDVGQVVNPASLTGHSYQMVFTQVAGVTTVSVNDTTAGTTALASQPYVPGQALQFDGMSLVAKGTPGNGDRIDIAPSQRGDIFSVLGNAAAAIKAGAATLPGSMLQSIRQLDSGLDNLSSGRSLAGAWLNRADAIESIQQGLSNDNEQVRSHAEDLDMMKGISEMQAAQSGMDAALKSYAQIQKLSLLNYMG